MPWRGYPEKGKMEEFFIIVLFSIKKVLVFGAHILYVCLFCASLLNLWSCDVPSAKIFLNKIKYQTKQDIKNEKKNKEKERQESLTEKVIP